MDYCDIICILLPPLSRLATLNVATLPLRDTFTKHPFDYFKMLDIYYTQKETALNSVYEKAPADKMLEYFDCFLHYWSFEGSPCQNWGC